MLIFSSLQSSGNATLLQNVRGKRAKNGERERENAKVATYANSLKNENKFLNRLNVEI
jgi:hypothetical protein